MTDYWSKEEGAIFDSQSYILPCRASTAILEGSCVTNTTTATDMYFEVGPSTALGDGFGVATRAATAQYDVIPVLFYGCYKFTTSCGSALVKMGSMVMNSLTTSVTGQFGGIGAIATSTLRGLYAAGTSYILGMSLSTSTANGDDIVVLVGKCL